VHSQQHKCQHKLVKIHGRTLKNALETTKANNKFGNFSLTHWVEVCPQCDAYALGIETTHPWPFLCSDGVMRTVEDFNQHSQQFESENMDLCGFIFSKSALNSAIALIQIEDSSTEVVEEMGARVAQNQNDAFSLQFSKDAR
jgi:hypothetical protein